MCGCLQLLRTVKFLQIFQSWKIRSGPNGKWTSERTILQVWLCPSYCSLFGQCNALPTSIFDISPLSKQLKLLV